MDISDGGSFMMKLIMRPIVFFGDSFRAHYEMPPSDDEHEDLPLDNPLSLPQLGQANNVDQDELLCN